MYRKLLIIGMALAAAILPMGCGAPPGGGGADFDDTLYYTKTDIDAMFANYYSKAAVDGLLPSPGSFSYTITPAQSSYAGGTLITVPAGGKYVILKAFALDVQAAEVTVRVGDSGGTFSECKYPAGAKSTQLLFFDMRTYTSDPKIWIMNADSMGIQFYDVLWLK